MPARLDGQGNRLTSVQPQTFDSAGRTIGLALLAGLLSLFLFSPNFLRWSALGTPFLLPEVARADDALRQLAHPFAHIGNYTNRVLQWRLFFPLLGHGLALPPKIYLALPHAGCLLVLIFVIRLMRKHGCSWFEGFAAATLLATCSWFFVSTGLLGFFDSWYVLGLLFLVFAQDLSPAIAAVLVTPWIDERFVIMWPLALALRWQYRAAFGGRLDGRSERCGLICLGAALLPWVFIRLWAFGTGHDPVTAGFLRDLPVHQGSVGIKYYFLGLWQGIRWAWIFAGVWLVFAWRQGGFGRWLILAFLATLILNLVIAEDLSRSVSTLAPLVVLGVLLLKQRRPGIFRPALVAACALNLVFPAAHVVGDTVKPIRYFYAALRQTLPTGAEAAFYYNQYAVMLARQHRLQEALLVLNIAIAQDPARARIRLNRAAVYASLGKLKEALGDADRAVALDPKSPDAWLARGRLRIKSSDAAGAFSDLEQALHQAPTDWSERQAVRTEMRELQDKMAKGGPQK